MYVMLLLYVMQSNPVCHVLYFCPGVVGEINGTILRVYATRMTKEFWV